MNGKEKIVVERFVYILIIALLILSLFPLYTILKSSASFGAWLEPVHSEESAEPDRSIPPVPEPSEAYAELTLTFGGLCTPASMLGSSAYGTFNAELAEKGAAYFFRDLTEYTQSDDFTLAGCSAVLSDRDDLTAVEKEKPEWYRAPSSAAEIFPAGGVDTVLLAGERLRDYGADGMEESKTALTDAGVRWGADGMAVTAELREGIRLAVSCCELTGSEGEKESAAQDARSWIKGQRDGQNFLVIYVYDDEDNDTVSPLKERILRSFIDAGANLVIGSCGSTLQRAEEYGGGLIAYSLGTLLDGTAKYPEKYTALLQVHLKANSGAIFETSWEWIPCRTYTESASWSPAVLDGDDPEREQVLAILCGE